MTKQKNKTHHFITVNHKRYPYTLNPVKSHITHFECPDANISQEFLNEDLAHLLLDLPHLILAEKQYQSEQTEMIRFRIRPEDKKRIEQKAIKEGYKSVSSFLRSLALKS